MAAAAPIRAAVRLDILFLSLRATRSALSAAMFVPVISIPRFIWICKV
jgi:hypothetical protein